MSRQTILIVDDEKRNIKLLEAILANEHRIISAESGYEALGAVETEKPDLILLDVMMPGINGIQVCRTLKSAEQTQMIPIIIVTALSDREDRVQAYQAGADDFLSKPVDRIELLGRTKSLLRIKASYDREVRSREVLRSVFDSILEPLIMVDEEMNQILTNNAANDLYAGAEHDRGFKTLWSHFRQDDSEELLKEIQASIRTVTPLHQEIGPVYIGDNVAYEEISVYPIKSDLSESKRSIIRIRDITERQLLAKRMAEQRRVETMSLLITSLQHQINNPNNFILFNMPILKGYVQSMISIIDRYACDNHSLEISGMSYGDFREDVTDLIHTIERGSSRINMIISKLKELAQEKLGEIPESVNLETVIQKAISLCETELKKTVKVMDVYVEPGLPRIIANQESLTLVIINILTNAAEAVNKQHSRIKLNARKDELSGDNVIIEISDNGSGMNDMTRERVFDAFFSTKVRVDGNTVGMGIGLHVSKKIIEKMGGRIFVESVADEGCTFRIIIPVQGRTDVSSGNVSKDGLELTLQ
jgi:PAS domain S-box-containing protein